MNAWSDGPAASKFLSDPALKERQIKQPERERERERVSLTAVTELVDLRAVVASRRSSSESFRERGQAARRVCHRTCCFVAIPDNNVDQLTTLSHAVSICAQHSTDSVDRHVTRQTTCDRTVIASRGRTRSQAVARIADRTASQQI